ncbi:MAG: PAS domain S-box protein, partial [Anaerolineales bacterium]
MTNPKNAKSTETNSLLESLNLVAASFERSIQSTEELYRLFGEGIAKLGLRGGIIRLDDSGTMLSFQTIGFPNKILKVIPQLEKLAGISINQFSAKVEEVDVYRHVIEKREAVFAPNSNDIIPQVLKGRSKKAIEKMIGVFGGVPEIYAPLVTQDKVHGIINLAGSSLTKDDVSAVSSFAIHLSVALENARLFEALRSSETTYRTLVDTSPDAVTMTDLDGVITYVSPRTLALHGIEKPEELIGKSSMDLIAPEEHARVTKNIARTLKHGAIRNVEYTLVRADGSRFAGELNAAVIKDKNGKPTAFIATIRDVSDRKKAEHVYRRLVDQSIQGIVIVQDGRIKLANEAFCGITGYRNEELLNLTEEEVQSLIHPDDQQRVWGNLRKRLLGNDVPSRYTYRGLRKDGSVCWIEMVASRIDYRGKPAVQGAILDITERVIAQEVIKESEEKLHDIYRNVTDILYFHDMEGNFIEANLFHKTDLGYSEDEIRQLGVPGLIPERFRNGFDDYMGEVTNKGEAQGLMRISTKEGEERVVEYRNTLVCDDSGPVGVRGSARDITDRLRMERDLVASEERYRHFLENFQGIAFQASTGDGDDSFYIYGKVEEITGYSVQEFETGEITWLQMVLPSDRRKMVRRIVGLRSNPGEAVQELCRVRRKDGETRWARVLMQAIPDDHNQLHVHGAMYDITERMATQDKLRISEERYRTLVDNLRVGVYRTTAGQDGSFLHANPAMAAIFGYDSLEDLKNAKAIDLYQNQAERQSLLDEVMARGYVRDREFQLRKKNGTPFWASINATATFNEQGELEWLDGVIEDVTDRRRAEEKLLRDAFFDGLTNLPNRALLLDRLDRAIERSKRRKDYHCAVLFMDLDRFKIVNDSLGHGVGDMLLISVAGRLEKCLRSSDTVARLGGDEFVVLLEELKDLGQATFVADRIREELNRVHNLNGHEVFTSGSIGIVMTVQGYDDPADVLRDADIAMYGAKLAGKDRYQIFDPTMHALAIERLTLETELRRALTNNEFCVHYQPIVMMKNEELFGFEALIRWEHPERGLISPGEFLPVLEETGLIIQVGRWVLQEACQKIQRWNEEY